jgi:hypothetical protein
MPVPERPVPTDAELEAVVAHRSAGLLEARLRDRDRLQTERSRRFVPLARHLAESEDERRDCHRWMTTISSPPLPTGGHAAAGRQARKAERTSRERSDRERESGGGDRAAGAAPLLRRPASTASRVK